MIHIVKVFGEAFGYIFKIVNIIPVWDVWRKKHHPLLHKNICFLTTYQELFIACSTICRIIGFSTFILMNQSLLYLTIFCDKKCLQIFAKILDKIIFVFVFFLHKFFKISLKLYWRWVGCRIRFFKRCSKHIQRTLCENTTRQHVIFWSHTQGTDNWSFVKWYLYIGSDNTT